MENFNHQWSWKYVLLLLTTNRDSNILPTRQEICSGDLKFVFFQVQFYQSKRQGNGHREIIFFETTDRSEQYVTQSGLGSVSPVVLFPYIFLCRPFCQCTLQCYLLWLCDSFRLVVASGKCWALIGSSFSCDILNCPIMWQLTTF